MRQRWRWRGQVALLAVSLAFVLYPLLPNEDVVNSDWPAFATGARLIVSDPAHLYDLGVQKQVQHDVTGGRVLVTLGIEGILPFLAPAWVALLAVPFDALGTDLGGRAWVLFGLVCLAFGLFLATRPRPPAAILPGFASVPTALMLLNAQLDGIVALGIGAAIFLYSRPYLAGLALGLTLVKPQLVLPLGAAVILAREWKVLAGWALGGAILLVPTLVLNPHWISDWLGETRGTVTAGSREVDLPHIAVALPGAFQTAGLVVLTVLVIGLVVWLARRLRGAQMRPAIAVLVAGGVLASPHALPADLVLVGLALAVWGRAEWFDWLALSLLALVAALTAPPAPAVAGVVLVVWVCLRASGFTWPSRAPAPASPR